MEGQIDIFTLDKSYNDMHYDKFGRGQKAPKWMHYERCENCARWNKYPTEEQPPMGWGCYGFCECHKQRVGDCSYCGKWEERL